jgi:AcrR family transcriptional regulator
MDNTFLKEKRKELIFEAALVCFTEKGYEGTTMEAIINAAGMSKGGLYHYFKSKRELFLELFHFRVNRYFEQMKTYIIQDDSPEERLKKLILKAGEILKQNEDFYKFCLEFLAMGVRDQEIRRTMTDFYRSSLETFKGIIEDGIKADNFESDLDSEMTARAFYLLVMGVFFTYFSIDVDFDILAQQNFQISRILNGIKKK